MSIVDYIFSIVIFNHFTTKIYTIFYQLIRIKIQDLPTDTMAQLLEHRRDKPWVRVRIVASIMF